MVTVHQQHKMKQVRSHVKKVNPFFIVMENMFSVFQYAKI